MADGRTRPPADAPPMLLTFLEQRAMGEVGAFLAATPLLRMVGRGDRHPVLVLPGFTASDRSTELPAVRPVPQAAEVPAKDLGRAVRRREPGKHQHGVTVPASDHPQ